MSYTTFAGARTWDGTEAASIHGASSALGASIDGSLVPSFLNETARNTAAAGLIAAGHTGMTCYVQSRLGTCTYLGIPPGGVAPTNGWVWATQNRVICQIARPSLVTASSGPGDVKVVATSGSVVLSGGQRLIQVTASCDLAPWDSGLPTNACAGRMGLTDGGTEFTNGGAWFPVPIPGFSTVLWASTVERTARFKATGTHTWAQTIYQYLGDGCVTMWNGLFDVTDMGPVD